MLGAALLKQSYWLHLQRLSKSLDHFDISIMFIVRKEDLGVPINVTMPITCCQSEARPTKIRTPATATGAILQVFELPLHRPGYSRELNP